MLYQFESYYKQSNTKEYKSNILKFLEGEKFFWIQHKY